MLELYLLRMLDSFKEYSILSEAAERRHIIRRSQFFLQLFSALRSSAFFSFSVISAYTTDIYPRVNQSFPVITAFVAVGLINPRTYVTTIAIVVRAKMTLYALNNTFVDFFIINTSFR